MEQWNLVWNREESETTISLEGKFDIGIWNKKMLENAKHSRTLFRAQNIFIPPKKQLLMSMCLNQHLILHVSGIFSEKNVSSL